MIYYLPLEPYRERYTLQLAGWTTAYMRRHNIPFVVVEGQALERPTIRTGVVLDAHGRSHYALTQMAALVQLLADGAGNAEDVIYIDDMFHPGWEALPYILDQSRTRPRIYSRCYAQSVDRNDFTFDMRRWMRRYEQMVNETCDGVFLASTCQVDMLWAALFDVPLHVAGLPFDADEVRQRAGALAPLSQRTRRVVFASRWDAEKQPHFWMDMIEYIREQGLLPDYTFDVCTGADKLRSNLPGAVDRAYALRDAGCMVVHEGLSKEAYYAILKDSRAQFNCALQDFVSYTLLEASSLGVPSLVPSWLSMPEAVFHNADQMYCTWSVKDAAHKLVALLESPPDADTVRKPSETHSGTFKRMFDVMVGRVSLGISVDSNTGTFRRMFDMVGGG